MITAANNAIDKQSGACADACRGCWRKKEKWSGKRNVVHHQHLPTAMVLPGSRIGFDELGLAGTSRVECSMVPRSSPSPFLLLVNWSGISGCHTRHRMGKSVEHARQRDLPHDALDRYTSDHLSKASLKSANVDSPVARGPHACVKHLKIAPRGGYLA